MCPAVLGVWAQAARRARGVSPQIMGLVRHPCIAGSKQGQCLSPSRRSRVPSGQDEPTGGRVRMWDIPTAPGGTRRLHAKLGAGQGRMMPVLPKAWVPLPEPLPPGIFPGILPGTLGCRLQPATCHHCPQHVLTRAWARLPLLPPHPRSFLAPGSAVAMHAMATLLCHGPHTMPQPASLDVVTLPPGS